MRMQQQWLPRAWVAVIGVGILLFASAVLVAGGVQAADPTATAVPGSAQWPVAIHVGTCANPTTQPADQLGNLAPFGGASAATAQATMVATQGAAVAAQPPVLTVQNTIDTKIDDLVASKTPYAIVLHESATNYTTYLACGDLAGQPTSDDRAVVPLLPQHGSGWYGIAILAGSKSVPVVGSNQTQITVYVFQSGAAAGTPAATPAA